MTNPLYGASLFQPRKTDHVHHHPHLHSRKSSLTHARSHALFHNRSDDTENAELDPRGAAVIEVVQTIEVVQIIDGAGAIISTHTVPDSLNPDVVDSETGATFDINIHAAATTSTGAFATSTVDPVSATDTATDFSDSSATETSVPGALSLTHISTSTSLPAPAFTTLSSSSNSTTSLLTSTSFTSSSSISLSLSSISTSTNYTSTSSTDSPIFTSSPSPTVDPTTLASSTLSSTTSPFPSSIASSTIWSSVSSSTSWSSSSDSTSLGTGGAGSGATATDAGTASTSAASGSSGDEATARTSKVAGGIVGGIAGLALLLGLAFMSLRMRKRGWCHMRLGGGADEPNAAARQALPAPIGGGGGGGADTPGAQGSAQQRSAPQAITASLAALTGKRTSRERAGTGTEMAERGFVRVSGKKLPPVLQFGGDGYSDPRGNRASHMSEASTSVYRDSVATFEQPHHRRLALGTPMRPESGIMTMHAGPTRTPVFKQAPSSLNSPSLPRSHTFPATDALGRTLESEGFSRETIGRTLAAQELPRDGTASRGSHHSRGSTRFTEHVT